MIAWRIFAFLALAYSVQGGADLELVYQLLDCCKRAIIEGVPSIPVPTHQPLVVPHDIKIPGSFAGININTTIDNIVWDGIPDWELKVAEQLSNDSDPSAVFNFDIYWKSFNMSMDYDIHYHALFIDGDFKGKIILNWTHTDWIGQINFTKPGFGYTEQVSELKLNWTVTDIDAEVSGLGLANGFFASQISSTLKNFLNNILGTGLSPLLQGRLNNYWLANSTRVPLLLDWCDNN